MAEMERLLSEFIDAWNVGSRPAVRDFLDRAEPTERSELSEAIAAFLDVAPTPAYSEAAMRALHEEPAVAAATSAFENGGSRWPSLLPGWRKRAGLTIDELAGSVLTAAGLRSGDRTKAAGYLEAMESGELDGRRISSRLIDVLAGVLSVDRSDLQRAGTPAVSGTALMFRSEGGENADLAQQLEVLSEALTTTAPGHRDDVDELFLRL